MNTFILRHCARCARYTKPPSPAGGPGERFQVCGACRVARYCSQQCLDFHWPVHRRVCHRACQAVPRLHCRLASEKHMVHQFFQRLTVDDAALHGVLRPSLYMADALYGPGAFIVCTVNPPDAHWGGIDQGYEASMLPCSSVYCRAGSMHHVSLLNHSEATIVEDLVQAWRGQGHVIVIVFCSNNNGKNVACAVVSRAAASDVLAMVHQTPPVCSIVPSILVQSLGQDGIDETRFAAVLHDTFQPLERQTGGRITLAAEALPATSVRTAVPCLAAYVVGHTRVPCIKFMRQALAS